MRCKACDDTGFRWQVPDGFNPFSAGGWNTIRAMFKVPCRECLSRRATQCNDMAKAHADNFTTEE